MTSLFFIEHANGKISDQSLKAISATADFGEETHGIIAGSEIDDAVTEAYKVANFLLKKNKDKISILLSPACSSYDMYDSYEERGRHFKSKVIKEYR